MQQNCCVRVELINGRVFPNKSYLCKIILALNYITRLPNRNVLGSGKTSRCYGNQPDFGKALSGRGLKGDEISQDIYYYTRR